MRTIVLGPPGTGKTTTLLNKVDDYLKQTDPDKIGYFASVSYTHLTLPTIYSV